MTSRFVSRLKPDRRVNTSLIHTQLMAEALRRDPDFQIVSSELNAASLLAASSSQRIDVFVLSAFAEEDAQRGFRILQEIREMNPHARAVMLLDSSQRESILEVFEREPRAFSIITNLRICCVCASVGYTRVRYGSTMNRWHWYWNPSSLSSQGSGGRRKRHEFAFQARSRGRALFG